MKQSQEPMRGHHERVSGAHERTIFNMKEFQVPMRGHHESSGVHERTS